MWIYGNDGRLIVHYVRISSTYHFIYRYICASLEWCTMEKDAYNNNNGNDDAAFMYMCEFVWDRMKKTRRKAET